MRNTSAPACGETSTSEHYRTLKFIHVIRPRNLTDAQRANIARLGDASSHSSAKRIYPSQISFNQDYNAPKFRPGRPLDFVKHLGQIALGAEPAEQAVDMFCSEFAWSLLALRDCDPAKTADAFKGIRRAVLREAIHAADAGDGRLHHAPRPLLLLRPRRGPLLVIDALKLPDAERDKLLHTRVRREPGRPGQDVGRSPEGGEADAAASSRRSRSTTSASAGGCGRPGRRASSAAASSGPASPRTIRRPPSSSTRCCPRTTPTAPWTTSPPS